jgi:hypothetical protein
MTPEEYFEFNQSVNKKRYDALRTFFETGMPAADVAAKYGYTLSSFYSLIRDFRIYLREDPLQDFFFKDPVLGRKPGRDDDLQVMIVGLRKMNFSAEDIVGIVNSKSYEVSYGYVYKVLCKEGFARLPRRSDLSKKQLELPPI